MKGNRVRWRLLGALLVLFACSVRCQAMPKDLFLAQQQNHNNSNDLCKVTATAIPNSVNQISAENMNNNSSSNRNVNNRNNSVQILANSSSSLPWSTGRSSAPVSARRRLFLVVDEKQSRRARMTVLVEEESERILSRTDRSVPSIRRSPSGGGGVGGGGVSVPRNARQMASMQNSGNSSNNSRTKSGSNLDRNERSANLSHITGSARKIQLYIKNRYLQILPDGSVNGTQDDQSDYTILQRTSVDIGKIKIQSVATCLFLCMDACGSVYSSREFTDDCIFNESMELHHYNSYSSSKHSNSRRIIYLALNRHGQPRKIHIPITRSLGKLSTYTNALTHTVEEKISNELLAKLFGQNHVQHGLKHLCESTQIHTRPLTESVMKPKPKCLAGDKQKKNQPGAGGEKSGPKKGKKKKSKRNCRDSDRRSDDDQSAIGDQDSDCLRPTALQVLTKRKQSKQQLARCGSSGENCQSPKKQKGNRKGGGGGGPAQDRLVKMANKRRRFGQKTTTLSPLLATTTEEEDLDAEDDPMVMSSTEDELDESSVFPAQNFNRLSSSLADDEENELID